MANHPTPPNAPALARRWWGAPALAGLLLLAIWALATGWPGPILADDANQGRLSVALPIPRQDAPIQQTFRPAWDGLSEVELLLVRHAVAGRPAGTFTLTLLDDTGREVTHQTYDTATLQHNQPLVLRFPPQRQAAGRTYTLVLGGDAANNVTAWGYDLDVYAGGELRLPGREANQPGAPQELYFATRYQLNWPTALASLARMLGHNLALFLLALALISLPGALLLTFGAQQLPALPGRGVWWAVALALGLAVWPLLWYWLTLLGGRWYGWLLWLLLGGGWLLLAGRWGRVTWWQMRAGRRPALAGWWRRVDWWLVGLLLLGLAVRLLAVRQLAFAPWVDASRHALITTLMVQHGQTLSGYEPLLPVDQFPYHFGFHTIPAGLTLMLSPAGVAALPNLLLMLGQLLNALVPLSMYAAGRLLTRRRGVGLLAAFLVALPFFFPGYFVTWGRLTQLTGLVLLPLLLALTWLVVRGGRGWQRCWWVVGLLAAGLLLIHVRVFLVYVPFAGLVWLLSLGRHGRQLLAAAGLALLLVAPRLVEFSRYTRSTGLLGGAGEGYNDFPLDYVRTGWERYFLWLAAAGLVLTVVGLWRRRAWAMLPLTLAVWMALVLGLLSGRVPGLPAVWLINLNSAYIMLFVPLGLGLAAVAGRVWRWLGGQHWLLQMLAYAPAGALLGALLLFGGRQQITILNPTTVLARPADLAGLDWVAANVPADATVAVNSWRWLGSSWAGSDGGAWLLPLTGRATTTPPADYIYSRELARQVAQFNETAEVMDWRSPAGAEWLRSQGVSYIFVGQRGGFFDPAALARNPALALRYSYDGVFIFAVP